MVIIYLFRNLRTGIHLPTLQPFLFSTQETKRAASWVGIRGISACKVYPPIQSPALTVSSYLTFSPSPSGMLCSMAKRHPDNPATSAREGSNFLWHFLFPFQRKRNPAIHRYTALCCPDFPPLLAKKRSLSMLARLQYRLTVQVQKSNQRVLQ